MNPFRNKTTALITGGSGGISMAVARRLQTENITAVVTDITENRTEDFPFFKCDLRQGEEVKELYDWFSSEYGTPDILILNAGRGIKEKLTEGDPEKWQEILDINLTGLLRCIRVFVPEMLDRRGGEIIFVSSVASRQPHPYGGIYNVNRRRCYYIITRDRERVIVKAFHRVRHRITSKTGALRFFPVCRTAERESTAGTALEFSNT